MYSIRLYLVFFLRYKPHYIPLLSIVFIMKTTNKSNKVPRPLNSYILFRVQKQREIVEQCPGANHRDISKITSKWWRELSPEEKQVYIDEAERLKQEHKLL